MVPVGFFGGAWWSSPAHYGAGKFYSGFIVENNMKWCALIGKCHELCLYWGDNARVTDVYCSVCCLTIQFLNVCDSPFTAMDVMLSPIFLDTWFSQLFPKFIEETGRVLTSVFMFTVQKPCQITTKLIKLHMETLTTSTKTSRNVGVWALKCLRVWAHELPSYIAI